MIITNDIYRYIGDSLLYDGFTDIREVPIDVIEQKINEYLQMKLCLKETELNNRELLRKLESFIDVHNKDKMMANFTFYILWYMSMLQSYEIDWKVENYIDTHYFLESDFAPNKIDSLVTSKNIDYISTFNFVLDRARELYYGLEGRNR